MVHGTGKEQILKSVTPGPAWRIGSKAHFRQVCKEVALVDDGQYKSTQLCRLLLLPSPAVTLAATILPSTITMRFIVAFAILASAVVAQPGSSIVTNLTPDPFYLWVVPDAWGSAIGSRVLVEAGG